jgi:basic amino acid/polyamine antiporter, APA family
MPSAEPVVTAPDAAPLRRDDALVRVIGTMGLAAGIINITIGGGIFRIPGIAAGWLGAAAPVAYLVCAVAMGLIVWCMADAGKRVSLTGGPYAYVGTAFGPYAGFISGVLLWMLGTFATAAASTVLTSSLGLLVPALSGPVASSVVLFVALAFWSIVNLRDVKISVGLNAIATAAKLLPLLLVAIGGAFFVKPENLRIVSMPSAGEVARTSLLLIFAFAGVEVALVPSGEVRDTARTVPRAIALAMIAITSLYIVLQMVSQGILGSGLAQATVSPLADAAGASLGGWARSFLLAGATISIFGYLGGITLSMPRILYSLARDGFLPRVLGSVHPVYRTPQPAIVVQSLITLMLAITGTFEKLTLIANVSVLAMYLGCALASWRLSPTPTVIPWIASAVIVWLLTGMTANEWLAFGASLAFASLFYLIVTRLRKS